MPMAAHIMDVLAFQSPSIHHMVQFPADEYYLNSHPHLKSTGPSPSLPHQPLGDELGVPVLYIPLRLL